VLSFQILVGASANQLIELLDKRDNAEVISEKSALPFPEPVKMILQTIALLVILGIGIAGALALFAKNLSVEALLFLVIVLTCTALVVFVFYQLRWKKNRF
jgi:hypothetical protein